MVKQIECIRSELQSQSVRQKELPSQRKVNLDQTEPADVIPGFRALLPRGGNRERIGIE
jgi:hypothetical protein